jgi:nitric oxide synthase oxygenase domain/subunit
VGTQGFFQQLDDYRYDKLNYLPRLVNFEAYRGNSFWKSAAARGSIWFALDGQVLF